MARPPDAGAWNPGCVAPLAQAAPIDYTIITFTAPSPADQLWTALSLTNANYLYLFASNHNFSAAVTGLNIAVDISGFLFGPSGASVLGGGTFSIAPADVTAIPEPTLLVLLGTGLLGAAAARPRKAR